MLQTLMNEIQGILNSRPLTLVSCDSKDLDPLTTNHLLLLRANPNLHTGSFCKEDVYSRSRWKQLQYMTDIFSSWKRWLKECLPTPQKREKWMRPSRCFMPGDLFLIADESMPRGKWPFGRVIEGHHGMDGYLRSVKGRTRSMILTRPVTKLCILEGHKDIHYP